MKKALALLWKVVSFIWEKIGPIVTFVLVIIWLLLGMVQALNRSFPWIFVLGFALLFGWAFVADRIRDRGFRINLGFWKYEKKPFDWEKWYEENTTPVTNPVHRAIFERMGEDPDKMRIIGSVNVKP